MKRVVLLPEARADALSIFRWYEQQRSGLGVLFRGGLDLTLERIRASPLAHPVVYRELRRALVERFPYSVFYRDEPGALVVVAIVHGRRRPQVWRRWT